MATQCRSYIGGLIMRATRLDECGNPVEGPCSTVTTDGFITVAMSDDLTDAEAITRQNAAGRNCYFEQSDPQLNFIGVTLTLCSVDPDFFEITTGSPLILNGTGDTVGFATDTETYAQANFALEVWTKLARTVACPTGAASEHGYLLLPWVAGAAQGDVEISNDGIDFTIAGSTRNGTSWGVGPYDVVLDEMGVAGPLLSPLTATTHRIMQLTQVQPPEAVCGCQPLELPSP